MRGWVDCSKVYVEASMGGAGVFAACDIRRGELVERGIVRRLPPSFDGNACAYVLTWSDDRTIWAMGSGCATYYNCADDANTEIHRDFAHDTFEIRALRDIAQDEELTQAYKSKAWRKCFSDL